MVKTEEAARFRTTQFRYAGSDGDNPGYIEVLRVYDPPLGHTSYIFHCYSVYGQSMFFECPSMIEAREAFRIAFSGFMNAWKWSKLPKPDIYRRVRVVDYKTPQRPWFRATISQEIDNDFIRS